MALQTIVQYTYTCDGCGVKEQGTGSAEPHGWRSVPEEKRYGQNPYRHFCTKECAEQYGARLWGALWTEFSEPGKAA